MDGGPSLSGTSLDSSECPILCPTLAGKTLQECRAVWAVGCMFFLAHRKQVEMRINHPRLVRLASDLCVLTIFDPVHPYASRI